MQSQVHFLMATTLMHLIPQKRKSIIKSSTKRERVLGRDSGIFEGRSSRKRRAAAHMFLYKVVSK